MSLHIAEGFIMEQVLEYFAMDNYDSLPISEDIPDNIENRSRAKKKEVADKILLKFMNRYQHADFNIEKDSMFLLKPPEVGSEEDRVMLSILIKQVIVYLSFSLFVYGQPNRKA